MATEEFKRNIDKAVNIIESCWDENNPKDKLTFDERLEKAIQSETNSQVKEILQNSKRW